MTRKKNSPNVQFRGTGANDIVNHQTQNFVLLIVSETISSFALKRRPILGKI